MSDVPSPLGFSIPRLAARAPDRTEHVIVQQPLHRVLAFVGRSIDDVVNCPIVKNQVAGYWKLQKNVLRTCEAVDMDRWWNPPRNVPRRPR